VVAVDAADDRGRLVGRVGVRARRVMDHGSLERRVRRLPGEDRRVRPPRGPADHRGLGDGGRHHGRASGHGRAPGAGGPPEGRDRDDGGRSRSRSVDGRSHRVLGWQGVRLGGRLADDLRAGRRVGGVQAQAQAPWEVRAGGGRHLDLYSVGSARDERIRAGDRLAAVRGGVVRFTRDPARPHAILEHPDEDPGVGRECLVAVPRHACNEELPRVDRRGKERDVGDVLRTRRCSAGREPDGQRDRGREAGTARGGAQSCDALGRDGFAEVHQPLDGDVGGVPRRVRQGDASHRRGRTGRRHGSGPDRDGHRPRGAQREREEGQKGSGGRDRDTAMGHEPALVLRGSPPSSIGARAAHHAD